MRRALLVVLALLASGLSGVVEAEDNGGSVVEAALEWEDGRIGAYRLMFVPFKPEPPEGLEPLAHLKEALYARIRWGGGRGLSLALELATGGESLYVDLDGDGDLADETAGDWPDPGGLGARIETVRVTYPEEEESEGVQVRFFRSAGWERDKVRILPWVHRRGRVELGGRLRLVALLDDRADLRFDDPERAHLFVDLDGDERFDSGYEEVGFGQPFRAGEEGWQAESASASGRTVRFVRLGGPPPAPPRAWPRFDPPAAGREQTPPAETFEELERRFEEERPKPYADRYQTIMSIGRVGSPEALALLLHAVHKENDVNVRAAAARALGNPAYLEEGGKGVVEIALSSSSPAAVASGAIQALHDMGYPKREQVYRELLGSNEAAIVGSAARYLAYLGTPEAVKAVLAAWRDGAQDALRFNVYQGLRSLPDGPPLDVVLEAAASEHTSLAAQAIRDLWAIGHPRAKTAALAAAARRPVVEYLGKAAADVLAGIGDAESVKALLAMAQEGTPGLELHVAQRLAPVRDAGAVGALVDGLKAKDPKVRALAAQVLAGIVVPAVTKALMERVKRERDEVVLEALLEALGDHGDEQSVDLLLSRAKKRNAAVRRAAIRALARVGMGDAKVRKFFLTLLTSRRWEDRVIAIDAAAATGDVKLVPKLVPNLDHEQRSVRLAAAEALGTLRGKAGILPLIERLEKEEEARIVDAVAKALYRITGMNLYDDAALWRRWWAESGATFEVPESVKDLPPQDAGGTRAGFYGIPVRSGRVIFVIDQSGSMSAEDSRPTVSGAPSGNRLDVAVKEVLGAVKAMKDRDFVNVILFHSTIHPWKEQLTRLTSRNRGDLQRHLLQKTPTGGTNLYDGLEVALLDPEVDTIFVLSDGMPGAGRYVAKEDILRAVRRLNQTKRVAIHAVSIGLESDLMKQLAAQNGGQYVRR